MTKEKNILTLDELSKKWGSDKHVHGFTNFYESFFLKFKKAKKVCEIGIGGVMWQQGGQLPAASSRVWLDYFPSANVFIFDSFDEVSEEEVSIIENFLEENKSRISLTVGDQSNRKDLESFVKTTKEGIDILVDDGGHSMEQQQVSLGFLFPYIKNGGIYVLEDLHTSLPGSRPRFGLKKDLTNSTLKMLENFISDGKIISEYMSEEEILYLNSNIEYCEIFKNPNRNSITCIIGKNK